MESFFEFFNETYIETTEKVIYKICGVDLFDCEINPFPLLLGDVF